MPITELRIDGVRAIASLRLHLSGLTVLIGDNGSGKSTIIECCELLRRSTGDHFIDELHGIHGGQALLRQGASELRLGVTMRVTKIEADELNEETSSKPMIGSQISYDLMLGFRNSFAYIKEESLLARPAGSARSLPLLHRSSDGEYTATGYNLRWKQPRQLAVGLGDPNQTLLLGHGRTRGSDDLFDLAARLILTQLRNMRVHLPFEVTAAWVARAMDRKTAMRTPALLTPASQLDRLGINLASAYHALKNTYGPSWSQTMRYIQLGLGERIEDIVTWADPGGGNIGLAVKLKGHDQPIPASQLSDGMLSYLAWVALVGLQSNVKPSASLMALDEPDLHLHPQLLMRVLDLLESVARECPVLLATHSDRLLDGLTDPAGSVVLCELDEHDATRLVRPDPQALARWLERYRGIGDIRAAGHEPSVLTKVEPT